MSSVECSAFGAPNIGIRKSFLESQYSSMDQPGTPQLTPTLKKKWKFEKKIIVIQKQTFKKNNLILQDTQTNFSKIS